MEKIIYDATKEYIFELTARGWTNGNGWDCKESIMAREETNIKSQRELDEYLKVFDDDANPLDLMGDWLGDPEYLDDGSRHDVYWENRLIASDGDDEEIIATSGVWESMLREKSGVDDDNEG